MIKNCEGIGDPPLQLIKRQIISLGICVALYFVRTKEQLNFELARSFFGNVRNWEKNGHVFRFKTTLGNEEMGKVVHSRQNCQVTHHSVWKSPENWNSRRRRIINQLFEHGIFGVIFAYCGMPGMLLIRPLYAGSSLKNALHSKSSNRKASFPLYFARTNSIPLFLGRRKLYDEFVYDSFPHKNLFSENVKLSALLTLDRLSPMMMQLGGGGRGRKGGEKNLQNW